VRVVITGASGLIGTALAASLQRDGIEVTRLVRGKPTSVTQVKWDPQARAGGLDPGVLDGADGVVHLAGAPIAGGRWTEARKRELRDSRIASTTALVEAMTAESAPPPVLLCGSAIGWYGDTGDREVDESAAAGTGFLADLVRDWEAATAPASAAGIRVVNLRSGVVLSRKGGMLASLLPLFKLGLGARIGAGGQYLSWIALADEVRATRFLLDTGEISGPVNLTAPAPVTNAEFTAALATALRRPALLRVPGALVQAGLGELSGELLGSARVVPARLEQAGFTFSYPAIGSALAAALK
jgi:uncharacterized protein (TIGR01777 family)